jgi:hypothetical protein
MPRPPKPENARNPLRLLREILSEVDRPDVPITQAKLADIIQWPLDQIKNVEAARRPLSARLQHRVRHWTGAKWESETQQWMFGPAVYTREIYLKYCEVARGPIQEREIEILLLHKKIDALLEMAKSRDRYPVLFELHDALERCRQQFKITELADFFEATETRFLVSYDSGTGRLLKVEQDILRSAPYLRAVKSPGATEAHLEVAITSILERSPTSKQKSAVKPKQQKERSEKVQRKAATPKTSQPLPD